MYKTKKRLLLMSALNWLEPKLSFSLNTAVFQLEELTKLRASARDQGVYLRVLKNTLARRATQGTQFEPLADSMVGPLIYGISADPIASAKVLQNFAKGSGLASD
jgi:ribosomal protein L10